LAELGDGGAVFYTPEEIVWPPPSSLGIKTHSNQRVVVRFDRRRFQKHILPSRRAENMATLEEWNVELLGATGANCVAIEPGLGGKILNARPAVALGRRKNGWPHDVD
jgi:hypothetical protein